MGTEESLTCPVAKICNWKGRRHKSKTVASLVADSFYMQSVLHIKNMSFAPSLKGSLAGKRLFKVVPRAETWLAHLSHDKQCGVESSASLGVRSPSLTFSTPTCNDYRIFYRPSSSSKPLFHFIQPLLSSTPFFIFYRPTFIFCTPPRI